MVKKYLGKKEIQKEELKILEKTIEFLNKNNIKYYVSYGTLLGAVRHKGFIPWDDDIDLMIDRSEYNNLIKILYKNNNIIDSNLEAISFELGNADWPFMKIVNKNIVVEDIANCDKNLWIDIFPLDGVKKNDKVQYKKILIMRKLFDLKRYDIKKWKYKSKNLVVKIFKSIIIYILKLFDYNKIIKKYIEICSKYDINECNYIANNIWGSDVNDIFEKTILEDKKFEFEGLIVNGIKEYDKFLTMLYGDYMKLPPEEKRLTHNIKAYRVDDEEE